MSLATLICTKCKELKPTSAFSKDTKRQHLGGYRAWCKACRNMQSSTYRHSLSIETALFEQGAHAMLSCRVCGESKLATDFGKEKRAKTRGYRETACKSCKKLAHKAWRMAHRAHVNAYGRKTAAQWRSAHPEEAKRKSKRKSIEFRAKNPTYMAEWYKNNPEKKRAAEHRFAQRHPEQVKIKKRRLSVRYYLRKRARNHGLAATFTRADEAFCRAYFHYACAVCGNEEGFQWTIAMDHWIPLSSDDCPGSIATNMIPLCHGVRGCNNTSKRHKLPETWLIERFGPRKASQILKKIRAYFDLVSQAKAS